MKEQYNRRQFLEYAGIGSIMTSGLLLSGCQQKETTQKEQLNPQLLN